MMGHRDSHRGEGRVMHHRLGYLIAEAAPRPLLRLCAAAVTAVALLSACTGGEQQAVPQRQMVAAANPLAAEAGMAMLRQGGSAVDAAIATALVLGPVAPQSSGPGGGPLARPSVG